MPRIETKKTLLVAGPEASNVRLAPSAGAVVLGVVNEGTDHVVALTPEEAVNMGVALIQLASAAAAMAQAQQVQAAAVLPIARGPRSLPVT